MIRYLIAVYSNDKCMALVWSKFLDEVPALMCKYPQSHVIIHDVVSFVSALDSDTVEGNNIINNAWRHKRGGKPTKVRLIEKDFVFDSVKECSLVTGIGAMNIYQSIFSGYAAGKYHFEYYFDENDKPYQRVHGKAHTDRADGDAEADV